MSLPASLRTCGVVDEGGIESGFAGVGVDWRCGVNHHVECELLGRCAGVGTGRQSGVVHAVGFHFSLEFFYCGYDEPGASFLSRYFFHLAARRMLVLAIFACCPLVSSVCLSVGKDVA